MEVKRRKKHPKQQKDHTHPRKKLNKQTIRKQTKNPIQTPPPKKKKKKSPTKKTTTTTLYNITTNDAYIEIGEYLNFRLFYHEIDYETNAINFPILTCVKQTHTEIHIE